MYDEDIDYLSPRQAALMIGVTSERVRQLCNTHRLAHVRTPLGRLISRAVVEDFIAGRADRCGWTADGRPKFIAGCS